MRHPLLVALLVLLAAPASAQWIPTGGPPGGRFLSLAAPDGALLGTTAYTSLRYADGAWASGATGAGSVVAGGARVLARTGGGLAVSSDAGATFTPAVGTQPNWQPLQIDGPHLFAVNNDSLHASADDGATWTSVHDDILVTVTFGPGAPPSTFPVTVNPSGGALVDGDAVLVAGTAYVFGGVYRHAPGDTAWVALVQPGAPAIGDAVQPVSLVRHDGALWFSHSRGVLRSTDGGTTWADASAGLPPQASVELFTGAGGLVARLRGASALFQWTGAGWAAVPPAPEAGLEFASGDAFYAASATRVYAFDGTAWTALPDVVASSPLPVAVDASSIVVASGNQLLRSTDGAATWTAVLSGFTGPTAAAPGRIVTGIVSGLMRSLDGGATWSAIAQPALPASAPTTRPNALLAHGDALVALYGYARMGEHGVILEQYGGVFRSLDGGSSWADVSSGLPVGSLGRLPVTAGVAFSGAVVAVTGGGCARLLDGAPAWTPAACPAGAFRESASAGDTRLVRTSSSISASADGGASWAPLVAGLPVPTVPIAASRFWGGARFASTAAGLLVVADAGDGFQAYRLDGGAWTGIGTAFPTGIGWGGFLEAPDGTLYGGSLGRGLWRSDGIVALETAVRLELALDAPRPNPARGAARVRFTLPAATDATVAVFDVLGRRVAVLAEGRLAAGGHEAVWATGAAAGVYVVRLTTPGGVLARPLTVVR